MSGPATNVSMNDVSVSASQQPPQGYAQPPQQQQQSAYNTAQQFSSPQAQTAFNAAVVKTQAAAQEYSAGVQEFGKQELVVGSCDVAGRAQQAVSPFGTPQQPPQRNFNASEPNVFGAVTSNAQASSSGGDGGAVVASAQQSAAPYGIQALPVASSFSGAESSTSPRFSQFAPVLRDDASSYPGGVSQSSNPVEVSVSYPNSSHMHHHHGGAAFNAAASVEFRPATSMELPDPDTISEFRPSSSAMAAFSHTVPFSNDAYGHSSVMAPTSSMVETSLSSSLSAAHNVASMYGAAAHARSDNSMYNTASGALGASAVSTSGFPSHSDMDYSSERGGHEMVTMELPSLDGLPRSSGGLAPELSYSVNTSATAAHGVKSPTNRPRQSNVCEVSSKCLVIVMFKFCKRSHDRSVSTAVSDLFRN